MAMPAVNLKDKQGEGEAPANRQQAPQTEPLHEAVLTREDYVFLASLPEQRAIGSQVRADMADLLTDEETLSALERYKDFFAFGGVDAGPAIAALPRAIKLKRVRRQLLLMLDLVQRHTMATAEPIVGVVSDVRRMVVGTPEGSAVRDAFAVFDERWRETFRGGRAASRDDAPEPADPTGGSSKPR